MLRFFNATFSLTNFKIQKYYQNELEFNEVYSRNNLPKIKDINVINLHVYGSIGALCLVLSVNAENLTYSDRLGVKNIPKQIRKFIENKNILTNIYIKKHTIQ